MADPITIAATAMSVASAGASIYSGIQQSKGLNQQADAAWLEGKIAGIRGKQQSAAKRDELNRVLSAIDTMRVSRGVGLDSPTSFAIRGAERERAKYAINAAQLGTRLEQLQARTKQQGLESAASSAVIGGFAQALPSLASAAAGFA